jgi:hypothetical protein
MSSAAPHFEVLQFAWASANTEFTDMSEKMKDKEKITVGLIITSQVIVEKGKSHPLSITINSKTPAFPPRTLSLTVMAPNQSNGANLTGALGYHMTYADDILNTWVGIGSQADGLGHLGENDMLYNWNNAGDVIKITGLTKLGVDKIPPMIARAVIIDMTSHFGVKNMEAGQAITPDGVKAAMKSQNIKINEGDIILFYTGWTDHKLNSDPKAIGLKPIKYSIAALSVPGSPDTQAFGSELSL